MSNPYLAPTGRHEALVEPTSTPIPAGQGRRLLNLIIDQFAAQFVIGTIVGVVIVVVGGEDGHAFLESVPGALLGIPIILAYYIFFEATTSRTLGKLLTGTIVVNETGGKPTFGQILGRSFARLIPFEALSFLGKTTRGWHDKLPRTYVVRT